MFKFNKKSGKHKYSVEVSRSDDGRLTFFSVEKNLDGLMECKSFDSNAVRQMCRNYNSSLAGNIRGDFDNIFPLEFVDIARVIGITNHLAHYFGSYWRGQDEASNEFVAHCMGFTFIDWNEVAAEKDNQLLYLTTEEENVSGKDLLAELYEKGEIFRIDFGIRGKCNHTYCIDSIALDKHQESFMRKLKIKINNDLRRKFPEK